MSTRVTTTVTKQKVKKTNRRRARPGKLGQRNRRVSTASTLLSAYTNTLNDPFDFGPVVLGYGTFEATTPATAYVHGTTDVNADGSCSFALTYSMGRFVETNNGGVSSLVWSDQAAANQAVIAQQGNRARVVSAGLRACPITGSTASPGICYAASVVGSRTTLIGLSSTNISQAPGAHIGLGVYGATVLMRPIDVNASDFHALITNAFPSSSYDDVSYPYTSPIITFQGLAAGTKIAWEAVVNLEILPPDILANTLGPFNRSVDPGLSGPFPVFASLFNAINPLLRDAVSLDFGEGGPNTNMTTRARLHTGRVSRSMRSSRMVLGGGSSNLNNLAAENKESQYAHGQSVRTNEDSDTSHIAEPGPSAYDSVVRAAAVAAGATGVLSALDSLRRAERRAGI